MIRKSADSLTPWSPDGDYNYLSRVWYQRSPDRAGYAYKIDTSYPYDNGNPPDNNRKWVIDYTYAAPWNEYGKYIIGARVYYFNGQTAYVYKASARYFGGTGKPNEEVDADGIRTWEIELEYSKDPEVFPLIAGPPHSQFVWPTRHFGGLADGKLFPWEAVNPEEYQFLYIDAAGDEGSDTESNGVLKFIKAVSGKTFNDYAGINSVYQSYPYDEYTYMFHYKELDANGNKQPRGRGIHWGNFVRDVGNPTDEWRKTADRQYTYCVWGQIGDDGGVGGIFGYGYFQKYGFAIEMWPSLEEYDFSLVPSIGFNDYYLPLNSLSPYDKTPMNPWPEVYTGVSLSGSTITSGGGGNMYINGNIRDPNGEPIFDTKTPDEACLSFAYFQRNVPFFSERESSMTLIVTQSTVRYIPYPIYDYTYDENGNPLPPTIVGYNYISETEKPSVMMYSEATSSYDRNYKETNIYLDHYTRTLINPKLIDFKKFRRDNSYTGIWHVGWKIN